MMTGKTKIRTIEDFRKRYFPKGVCWNALIGKTEHCFCRKDYLKNVRKCCYCGKEIKV